MKSVTILFLSFTLIVFSCANNQEENQAGTGEQNSFESAKTHPNDLFKNNCSMCHGYNADLVAPAIKNYSVDSILNFFDGKSRRDSIWEQHKKIQLARNDWERIAIQIQPGEKK